jgi:hypothetical protein
MLPGATPCERCVIRSNVGATRASRLGVEQGRGHALRRSRDACRCELTLRDGAVRRQAIDSLRQHLRQFLGQFLDG